MTDTLPTEVPFGDTAPATSMPTAVPHSREAEEAVVGAVFINPEVYYDVAQFLSADDFTSTGTAGSGRHSPACTNNASPLTC